MLPHCGFSLPCVIPSRTRAYDGLTPREASQTFKTMDGLLTWPIEFWTRGQNIYYHAVFWWDILRLVGSVPLPSSRAPGPDHRFGSPRGQSGPPVIESSRALLPAKQIPTSTSSAHATLSSVFSLHTPPFIPATTSAVAKLHLRGLHPD